LEAAVFRPQTGYYNDLSEEAAALLESLVNNHAFLDGNKRVGFAATHTFLLVNGFDLEVNSKAASEFMLKTMGEGKFRFASAMDLGASCAALWLGFRGGGARATRSVPISERYPLLI
jgi:prophage maintenance system killer protein